jgi:hypothetical protein
VPSGQPLNQGVRLGAVGLSGVPKALFSAGCAVAPLLEARHWGAWPWIMELIHKWSARGPLVRRIDKVKTPQTINQAWEASARPSAHPTDPSAKRVRSPRDSYRPMFLEVEQHSRISCRSTGWRTACCTSGQFVAPDGSFCAGAGSPLPRVHDPRPARPYGPPHTCVTTNSPVRGGRAHLLTT